MAQIKPWPVGTVRGVVSATGAKAEGILYVIPMTSKTIMRFPPEFLYRRLLQVAEDAAANGCQLMGLGAYTSVAGDAGLTVSKRCPIGVTSGNSYTVAATLLTLERAAKRCGIEISQAHLLIIGATGSIGAICARMAAGRVRELSLVSPRPEKLLALRRKLERDDPRSHTKVNMSTQARDYLGSADGIITTTSSVEPVVDIGALKPGCLVLDVARPPDIKANAAARREDVMVIESGEVMLPEGAEVTYDIGLPAGVIYACLAETLLLALDRRFGHFT
jgi:predicted amino acid dehydrogenase